MRIEGKIIKWKDDRGFGFLAADQGGAEVFAHITAFPRTGAPPAVGERVSFEVELEASGKKRAKNVLYLARSAAPSAIRNRSVGRRQAAASSSPWRRMIVWLLLGLALAAVAYKVLLPRVAPMWQPAPAPEPELSAADPVSSTVGQGRRFIAPVDERAVSSDSDMKAELQAFAEMREADEPIVPAPKAVVREQTSSYQCDGRQRCSQMRSCDEAKFFLKNCPNPKMDGNHDGIPCEEQWCTSGF